MQLLVEADEKKIEILGRPMKKDLGTMAGNGMAIEIAFRDHTRGAGPERGVGIGVGLRFATSEAGDGQRAGC